MIKVTKTVVIRPKTKEDKDLLVMLAHFSISGLDKFEGNDPMVKCALISEPVEKAKIRELAQGILRSLM